MIHWTLAAELARCCPPGARVNAAQATGRNPFGLGLCQIVAGVTPRLQDYARRVASGQGSPEENSAEARQIHRLLREALTETWELSRRLGSNHIQMNRPI